MNLTPLQEIFILLEDEKQVPLYRLNRWGKQTRGVLGKLSKYGWISKKYVNSEIHYSITPKGEDEIDNILKPLKITGQWDNKWRLVISNLPESKRDVRDRLRRYLSKLGMGNIQNSVWISPNDISDDVLQLAKKLNISCNIKIFEVSKNYSIDKDILNKCWNLPEIEDEYNKFNLLCQRILNNIYKDRNSRFTIKKLIFQYALILQKDPILPWEYRNKNPLRQTAYEYYLNLRTYIN